MEVFIHNLPDQTSDKQLEKYLGTILANYSIHTFCAQKLSRRGCATITFSHASHGQRFLSLHGQGAYPLIQLYYMTRAIHVLPSRHIPDRHLLLLLKQEDDSKRKATTSSRKEPVKPQKTKLERKIEYSSFASGSWGYVGTDLVFVPYYKDEKGGTIIFGKRSVSVLFGSPAIYRLEVPYSSIHSITHGTRKSLSLSLTVFETPKAFESLVADPTALLMQSLSLKARKGSKAKWRRVGCISKAHESVFSNCFVYRIVLPMSAIEAIKALKKAQEIPEITPWPTLTSVPSLPFASELTRLSTALASQYKGIPFGLMFQMQRLVNLGYLSPGRVTKLLPEISLMTTRSDLATCVSAVCKLFSQIPFAGPGAEAGEFDLTKLIDLLRRNEAVCKANSYYSAQKQDSSTKALIHKAIVTPAGTYLYGPDQEPMNRVLRKYSKYLDYFLKVTFADEDGEALRHSPVASNEEIYHTRFKKVLGGTINIAGRGFEFLGFSHSSLRAQTCWFMAPFTHERQLVFARSVIKDLGNFSAIRTPAKCAARIGQAFSDTLISVEIPPNCESETADVERNGRTFSDGVGVISRSIQKRICERYAVSHKIKPTVFQIRHAGAKGMLSVDPRLKGDVLKLRESMIKFKGSKDRDIEICGSGLRPLPMYLNQQVIKILEDLGVKDESFLKLQEIAIEGLRSVTRNPINAVSFLTRSHVGLVARVPWLIEKLNDLGLAFHDDDFLRDFLELAVLVQLRALKYRSRIIVEKAVTLYGIMDETGILREGEVFCVVKTEKEGRRVTLGRVAITRSPALHPGDVQFAKAVDVPADSPLNVLHNCVVFSQKGQRDLPSQLSGGDLDGDLYNVIYDPDLLPKIVYEPADYPRVPPLDIGREVERQDMTDFFIQFMENDQLGRIALLHRVLADQRENGTWDPDCLLLANKHSTAVDFSKTGIPADLTDLPRYNRYRPDFMAPGPRVVVEKEGRPKLEVTREPEIEYDDEDAIDASPLDIGTQKYYRSEKILGKLYRNIDEDSFFSNLQKDSDQSISRKGLRRLPMQELWSYVKSKTTHIKWKHLQDRAYEIKEMYEDCLIVTMSQYSMQPLQYLSEMEVFVGDIIGRYGPQSHRQREASIGMKEKFERDVGDIVNYIVNEDEGGEGKSKEALGQAIACLAVALTASDTRPRQGIGKLRSFGYVAAAVCLRELERSESGGGILTMGPWY